MKRLSIVVVLLLTTHPAFADGPQRGGIRGGASASYGTRSGGDIVLYAEGQTVGGTVFSYDPRTARTSWTVASSSGGQQETRTLQPVFYDALFPDQNNRGGPPWPGKYSTLNDFDAPIASAQFQGGCEYFPIWLVHPTRTDENGEKELVFADKYGDTPIFNGLVYAPRQAAKVFNAPNGLARLYFPLVYAGNLKNIKLVRKEPRVRTGRNVTKTKSMPWYIERRLEYDDQPATAVWVAAVPAVDQYWRPTWAYAALGSTPATMRTYSYRDIQHYWKYKVQEYEEDPLPYLGYIFVEVR
jgi:hypothetical protein